MVPTLHYLFTLSVPAFLLAPCIQAQDVIHFMDNAQVVSKVLEVGIDSIVYIPEKLNKKKGKEQHVPKAFIKFIEYENGQRYFVEHSQIFLTDGKLLLALVERYDENHLYYQDVYTRNAKRLAMRKVVAIRYNNNHRVNFMDKINLREGSYLAGSILEINDEEIVFENTENHHRKDKIDLDLVRSIEFKNGFEQEFTAAQPNK
ncbi:MAG: hypothetical protein WBA23_01685 [Tunicatimonas sp.]|uniref:hypothetical protein n=1 Tax=Tunicatimonas sp. TaxID=1940096 RepID=UPI003C742B8F